MDAVSLLDQIAFAWFVVAIGGYRLITEFGPLQRRSIVAAVQAQRLRWMLNMAARDNRMIDGIVLTGLSQGNAFFASTSALAIGGLLALVRSATRRRSSSSGAHGEVHPSQAGQVVLLTPSSSTRPSSSRGPSGFRTIRAS
jgi:uncharacterized membrane protein